MRGGAVAHGAISLVNAIASGKGATVSVAMQTEARVEVLEGRGAWDVSLHGKPSESRLVPESIKAALLAAGLDPGRYHGFAETASTMPIGVGLKSSSSASVAVAMATFDAIGRRDVGDEAILKCSTEASLRSGASITGALDDAASCLLGGVNIADNPNSRVLSSARLPEELDVVIRVPAEKSRRSQMKLAEARRLARVADSLIELCKRKDYWAAMTLNGLLYSGLLGYQTDAASKAVNLGAIGAGLSGTGPAVPAVFGPKQEDAIWGTMQVWSDGRVEVLRTKTSNKRAAFVG
jgi:shikimate kinase